MERSRHVYKYQALAKTALENLEDRRVWVFAPAKFNALFDCRPALADLTPTEVDCHTVR